MKTAEAIKHFGGPMALAEALDVTLAALYQKSWKKSPPWPRQLEIERLTGGTLKADPKPPKRAKAKVKHGAR